MCESMWECENPTLDGPNGGYGLIGIPGVDFEVPLVEVRLVSCYANWRFPKILITYPTLYYAVVLCCRIPWETVNDAHIVGTVESYSSYDTAVKNRMAILGNVHWRSGKNGILISQRVSNFGIPLKFILGCVAVHLGVKMADTLSFTAKVDMVDFWV